MTNFRFGGLTKHGRLAFTAGPVYGFEDPDAVTYCAAMGWGEATDDPADIVISAADFSVDPDTVFASGPNQGKRVMDVVARQQEG